MRGWNVMDREASMKSLLEEEGMECEGRGGF